MPVLNYVAVYTQDDISHLKIILSLVICILVSILIIRNWIFQNRKEKQGLDLIPGFKFLESVKELLIIVKDKNKILERVCSNIMKFGDISKASVLFEDHVFIVKPEYIQKLYSSKNPNHLKKSADLYRVVFEFVRGNGLFTSPVHVWEPHRKLLSNAFLYNYIKFYNSEYFNLYARRLVSKLVDNHTETEIGKGQMCQLGRDVNLCGLQIICHAIIGGKEGLPMENCNILLDAMTKVKNLTFERMKKPWLVIDGIWKLHSISNQYEKASDIIDEQIRIIIERKKSQKIETPSRESMLGMMLKSDMNENDIMSNLKALILGGYETTSATVHFLLMNLSLHQEHQNICRQEVDDVFSSGGNVDNENFSYSALSEMKHLERCALETLRLYPPISIIGRQIDEPLKLDKNLTLPAGINATIFIQSIHNNPKYYPNPEKFDPERFSTENVRNRHPYSYMPFAGGTRNCIGNKFALAEIKTVVAHLLQRFEIYTTDEVDKIPILPKIVLTPQRDYNFILKRRNNL